MILRMLICCLACCFCWTAQSGEPATEKSPEQLASESEAIEEEVLKFVEQHQPELAKLMVFLKKKQPNDYKQALRESRKVRERLLTVKDRDPDLYKVELALWKNAAELRLLAAAVSAKSQKLGDADREKLKELIARENELTIQRLSLEKARAEARVSQLTQQLERRQEQSTSVIAKGLKTWETRIERSATKSKN